MSNQNLIILTFVILGGLLISALVIRNNNKPPEQPTKPNTNLTVPPEVQDNTKNSPPPTSVERGDILNSNVKQLPKPELTIDTSKNYKAIITTSVGVIKIDLLEKTAPITVNNFVYLASNQFYNDVIFHRVIKGFMIQGGDPTGTGTGDAGYKFDDEPFEGEYTRGTVAMANSGANTNGSQFFIMHGDTPLKKDYVIFGKVEDGMNTVDAIAEAEMKPSPNGQTPSEPVDPIKMLKVEIVTE